MLALDRSDIPAPIQQILRVTEKHFGIHASPDLQRALPKSEFIDPLRFRWVNTPTPLTLQPPSPDTRASWSGRRAA